jgi:splicing factor 1
MAKDCPDRPRGADWRNGPPAPGGPGGFAGRPAAGRIGAGDAVDREYEVSQFLNLQCARLTKL